MKLHLIYLLMGILMSVALFLITLSSGTWWLFLLLAILGGIILNYVFVIFYVLIAPKAYMSASISSRAFIWHIPYALITIGQMWLHARGEGVAFYIGMVILSIATFLWWVNIANANDKWKNMGL